MNRINRLFEQKKKDVLNIYFTAGFPKLNDLSQIILELEKSGVDLIELGMPYSDPLADGETIQYSSSIALKNGMNLDLLFSQVNDVRQKTEIPIMLMGYYNQMIQYGEDKFLDKCVDAGIDGLIIPDIPLTYFEKNLQEKVEQKNLAMTFLVTPESGEERTKLADRLSSAFLYVVAKSSVTGKTEELNENQIDYFQELDSYQLKSPRLIGFGIHDRASFVNAAKYANGAIIGSAFIRVLRDKGIDGINAFVSQVRGV